jgi:PPOX class probable F420-dependent enzyme
MDEEEALRRLAGARVARMATAGPGGLPHVVPFVFVLHRRTLYWAVDRKPKRSRRLRRLENLEANPNVEVLADHYEEDWSRLWWVRASGTGRVLEEGPERDRALALLAERYPQYREAPPDGPVVAVDLVRVTGWTGG